MKNKASSLGLGLGVLGVFIAGNLIGKNQGGDPECTKIPIEVVKEKNTFSSLSFVKRSGDQLFFTLQGEGRVVVNEKTFFESSDSFSFASIPTEDDLALKNVAYLGNAKTGKFYNADSYPARGTEIHHRRFFQSKEAAVAEGFIPAKNLK